ncbi:26s proteasome non-atpase regulatory subunit 3/cop9 signalosome complex subunit 3 [Holotrichia oblita]|uniref:26s proteasome non-atpase regulatory subunit 3/cop9 signalosome complex subunit 3 n=1 Tax=Holotrichia oblita TaxID=644536 RepID=A0ACB9TD81_HOLOL|nr:26s proteasome non-atpase regulatory subunit 3/cop9 signalosome complex subunit 3 [Holotrichia oblita]
MVAENTDVEMKNADSPPGVEAGDCKRDLDLQSLQEIREQARQIEKAVTSKENRFISRVLRCLPNTRRKLNGIVLRGLISQIYPLSERESLLTFVEEAAGSSDVEQNTRVRSAIKTPVPEVDAYIHLLILVRLIDTQKLEEATRCSQALMNKITNQNRRTLDLIAAKCYFYHSRVAELTNRLDSIRAFLHARLRTATLRNDFEGQAVLINCLLRNYLHYSLYDQSDKLVSKCVFPETASNNEWARFLYYLGRIKAARLEYSIAHKHLVQAMRKAPQNAAIGFRQTVQKFLIVVELLLGDIPERQIFRQASMRHSLGSYFQLTQAVRMGNLQRFGEVLENFGPQFRQDHTYTLILRLRHNVIKTAIRAIGLSYSRISPQDIAKKLGLDSAEDAEFIVAKAIRDGVIEATLDPEGGYMRSKETYGKELESAEERREREQQDLELAKEMAEEDDDGFP